MATVRVRLETIGGRRVLQALNGLRRMMSRANASARGESTRTRRQVERDAKGETRAEDRASRDGARAVERGEKAKRRALRRTERERSTNHRAERRRQRQVRRAERRRRSRGRPGGLVAGAAAAVGGGLIGGARAGLGVARGLQSSFGIRSQQEIIGSAVDARQGFIRAAVQGGLRGPQIQNAIERTASIGRRTGVSPEAILQGISVSQERFSGLLTATEGGEQGLNDFFRNIEFMAEVSRATGSSMEDVIGAAGEFQRQFGLNAAETRDALSIVAEGALQGSLSLRDFASRFPAAIASFQGARGISGTEALREFQAIAQALRAGGLDPRVARTQQQNLLATLVQRQSQLRGVGINVRGENGRIRSVGDIVAQAARSRRAQDPRRLRRALGSQEATAALQGLILQEQRAIGGQAGALTLQQRIDVPIEEGAQLFRDTIEELNQDASGDIINQRIQREARLIQESDRLIERFGQLTRLLTELEDRDPFLTTVGAPIAAGAIQGAGAAAILSRLGGSAAAGGGGGVLASSAGAGGLAGLAGTGVGSASAGSIALFSAAGLAIAGAVTSAISATGAFESEDRGTLLEQNAEVLRSVFGDASAGSFVSAATGGQGISGLADAIREAVFGRSVDAPAERPSREPVELGPRSLNAITSTRQPGAGRRGEGAPGE